MNSDSNWKPSGEFEISGLKDSIKELEETIEKLRTAMNYSAGMTFVMFLLISFHWLAHR